MLLLMCLHSGEHWGRVFTGLEKSPCPTPCRTFHTKTKFLSSEKEKTEDRFQLRLFFIPEMTITTTDFVEPTISSMLSEVPSYKKIIHIKSTISDWGLHGSMAGSGCSSGCPTLCRISFAFAAAKNWRRIHKSCNLKSFRIEVSILINFRP